MRPTLLVLILYLAVAAQTTLADAVSIGSIGLELPAMVVAMVIIVQRGSGALAIAALIGLVEDTLAPGRLGIAMAWYLTLGWFLLEGCERYELRSLGRRAALTGLYVGLATLAVGVTRWAIGEPTIGFPRIVLQAAGIGAFSGLVAVPLWIALDWTKQALHRRQQYEI